MTEQEKLREQIAELIKNNAAIHSLNGHPTEGFVGNPDYLATAILALLPASDGAGELREAVQEIDALYEKATARPWIGSADGFHDFTIQQNGEGLAIAAVVNGEMRRMGGAIDEQVANAALICLLVNKWPLIRQALASGGPDGWRDIESAPKDGTQFLAYSNEGHSVAYYRFENRWGKHYLTVCHGKTWTSARGYEPTHWQPLPSPPQSAEGGGS